VIAVLLLGVGAAVFELVLTRGKTPEIDAPGSITERFHAEMLEVDKEVSELWSADGEGGARRRPGATQAPRR